jgi:ABC-type uncharacterized transport system substrate-binding protein
LIGYSREMAVNGALMSYGPNNAIMLRRAGAFIDKILKGSKGPGELPVEQPLHLNKQTPTGRVQCDALCQEET